MRRDILPVILIIMLATGCGNLAADHTAVEGTLPDELLKLRAGPVSSPT